MADSQLLIMNLMRVLTPEEINDLTTTYCGEKRVSLTSLMMGQVNPPEIESDDQQDGEGRAKILPFSKPDRAEVEDHFESFDQGNGSSIKCGENISILFRKLYGIKNNSMAGVIQDNVEEIEIVIEDKKSASTFILEEKVKLESSQRKLKSSDIIKTYKQVSAVDIEIEKKHKDDLRWSSSQGQLINKKQA